MTFKISPRGQDREDLSGFRWFPLSCSLTLPGAKFVAALSLLVALATGYYFFGLLIPGSRAGLVAQHRAGGHFYGNDFYPIWVTTRELLLHNRDPYGAVVTREIQAGLYGRPLDPRIVTDPPVRYRTFSYPLYTALLAAPLMPLSFTSVQIALSIFLPFLTAASVVFWLAALGIHLQRGMLMAITLLTFASYPVLEGLWAQQPALISQALLAATMAAIVKQRLALAGMLLALASLKPQMVIFFVLWIFVWGITRWADRKNLLLTATATFVFLIAASELALPGWFRSWLNTLIEYRHYTPAPLVQFVLGRILGHIATLSLVGIAIWACWRARDEEASSSNFRLVSAFVLAITVVILPSSMAIYDQILLLPAVFWVCSQINRISNGSRALRTLGILFAAVLMWQWTAACGVSVCSFLLPGWARTSQALLLPLRAAASLPFALIALLCFFLVAETRERPSVRLHGPSDALIVN